MDGAMAANRSRADSARWWDRFVDLTRQLYGPVYTVFLSLPEELVWALLGVIWTVPVMRVGRVGPVWEVYSASL